MYTECPLCDSNLQQQYRQRQWHIVYVLQQPAGHRFLQTLTEAQAKQCDLFQLDTYITYAQWLSHHQMWVSMVQQQFSVGDPVSMDVVVFDILTHLS
jgi:hypothetical protein